MMDRPVAYGVGVPEVVESCTRTATPSVFSSMRPSRTEAALAAPGGVRRDVAKTQLGVHDGLEDQLRNPVTRANLERRARVVDEQHLVVPAVVRVAHAGGHVDALGCQAAPRRDAGVDVIRVRTEPLAQGRCRVVAVETDAHAGVNQLAGARSDLGSLACVLLRVCSSVCSLLRPTSRSRPPPRSSSRHLDKMFANGTTPPLGPPATAWRRTCRVRRSW